MQDVIELFNESTGDDYFIRNDANTVRKVLDNMFDWNSFSSKPDIIWDAGKSDKQLALEDRDRIVREVQEQGAGCHGMGDELHVDYSGNVYRGKLPECGYIIL